MWSKKDKLHKKGEQQGSSAWRVFKLVVADTGRFFPYLSVFYVLMLGARAFWPAMHGYFSWPAMHGLFGLVAASAIVSAGLRVTDRAQDAQGRLTAVATARETFREIITTFFVAFGASAPHWKKWSRFDYLKYAASIALVVWAIAGGASILDVLILIFGCGVVLFSAVDTRVPYAAAGIAIFALPILQPFASAAVFSAFTVLAFELFGIAVLATVARFAEKKESFPQAI